MLTRRNLLATAPLTALGIALTTSPAQAATFTDLPPGSLFYAEINWAVTKGLLSIYPDGSIRPNDPVDRQTFARMIYTYRGKPSYAPPTKTPFSDVSTTHPYYKDICWLASQGITAGYWDKTFRPANLVERNTFAIFLSLPHGR